MEAVPRLPMLSLDLKVSPETPSFGPKLKQYIAECYREDPESYSNEVHQLEGLRSAAVRPPIDVTGCAALKRYFCQLRGLQSRFPMAKGQPAAVTFAWRDLFANIVCNLADIRFEMVCVLYNIGALYCKLGAAEPRTTPESMKTACTNFQSAVWAFEHLKEHYPQPSGVDLSPEIMKLFQDMCFGQALECILEKSMQDSRKPVIVGAIGMQTILHYRSALSALESSQTPDSLHETIGAKMCNIWIKSLSFKVAYISSIVYLFQGMQSEEQQRMGERVAYYQEASNKLQEAKKLSKGLPQIEAINEALTFTNDVVEGKRKAAKNENEFIYHEEVPDKDLLTEPKAAALAKGIPINFNDIEVSGPDIFGRLVPMKAHEASSMYSEEKAKLLRKIGGDVEIKDSHLNDFMSSLQLDELNVLNNPERLPQELIDICASLSVKTDAIKELVESMNTLADIHTEVDSMFSEIKSLIEEEENNEKDFQQIMGKRPPSNVSTELSREANKYLEAHNKANESNQTLHKAMTLHLANLKLLSLPLDELEKHVPSLETIKGNIDNAIIGEMRTLVEKVNEMRAQRSMFVLQLRECVNSDDITSQLLTRTGETLDDIFKHEIEKHNKLVNLIEQNMTAQENILKALTDAYAKYAPTRKTISDVIRKRESFFTAMTTSYETYDDLMKKSCKGIEFYRKLSSTVSRLLSRLKSICKVQQEERSQLLASNSQKYAVPSAIKPKSNTEANIPSLPISNLNVVPKEEAPSGPKLKDFLPYMKNRTTSQYPNAPETASVDTSYSSQLYPPYIRPAPVGSEGTNEPVQSKFFDSSSTSKQAYLTDYEQYKNYQLPQVTGTANSQQYLEQTTYSYGATMNQNTPYDPKMYPNSQYPSYQPYNPNLPMENMNVNPHISDTYLNRTVDPNLKQNVPNSLAYPISQANNSSLPQYNELNPSAGMAGYGNLAYPYPTKYPDPQQSAFGQNIPQDVYNPSQITNQPFTNYMPPAYPESSQAETNKLSNQMQNMNIGYTPSNQMTSNYGNVYTSLPNNPNMYDASQYTSKFPIQSDLYTDPNIQQTNMAPIGSERNVPPIVSQESYNVSTAHIPSTIDSTNVYSKDSYMNQAYIPVEVANQYNNVYQPTNQLSSYSNLTDPQSSFNPYSQTMPADVNLPSVVPQDIKPVPDGIITSHATAFSQSNYPAEMYSPVQQSIPINQTQNDESAQNMQPISSDSLAIKSHVHRDFLPGSITNVPASTYYNPQYQNPYYGNELPTSTVNVSNPEIVNAPVSQQMNNQALASDQTNLNANNSYQNHPGYGYNNRTGIYDYNYGYQNSSINASQNNETINYVPVDNQPQHNLYTNAGTYGTIQTSSTSTEIEQSYVSPTADIKGQYYSVPYGHHNNGMGENVASPTINQNVDQVVLSTPNEQQNVSNGKQLTYINSNDTKTTTTYSNTGNGLKTSTSIEEAVETQSSVEEKEVEQKEPSTLDLLSGLDFTIEQTPLMPEIRVPPVAEHLIRKIPTKENSTSNTIEIENDREEQVVTRPPKRDIFLDPSLLNKFTQEVKSMQQFVDGFTKKTHSGITMLDSKWKKIQDMQLKENHLKTTNDGKMNILKNASPDVISYDDSRVSLKDEHKNEYINASHLKQISSWCIPLIISDLPSEDNYCSFWHLVFQEKVAVLVCLLTEIELQGKFYGPTALTQDLEFPSGLVVTLDESNCNVNWTERKLTITSKNIKHKITHYQINVFPARVVSAPLVMLVDKILNTRDENNFSDSLPKTLVHCNTGAGRSSLIILLTMVMCQVRAGYVDLRDMLDTGLLQLCSVRTNVLEDTKYLVDIYRTVLFYVQGVLCSGTVNFNGEAVSVPSGASIPPPHIPSHSRKTDNFNKFSKESFEEMKQAAGLKSGDMQDPLSYLDPLWSLKKRKD